MMRLSGVIKATACFIAVMIAMATQSGAVAPSQEAVEKWKAEGVWEKKVDIWKAFKAAGGSSPETQTPLNRDRLAERLALGTQTVDTVNVIVILVDFSDNTRSGRPDQFDSILFSDRETDIVHNPTGSMTDYYMENSYGAFYITGDIYGWYQMDESYSYYVGADHGLSNGSQLAHDAVIKAKGIGGADFSNYDSNNDFLCDGLIIIHAGVGAETGSEGIWSHKGSIYPALQYDGVTISAYTMNPEKYTLSSLHPIGVFCHEYGHFLGLPDLYDIDYQPSSSDGLGRWSLMASGNYNGGSRTPAHLDAWCKYKIGVVGLFDVQFLNLYDNGENVYQAEIPCIEFNPVAYKLQNSASTIGEYWIVENRQKVGFDVGLPGSGLCIYHVDLNAPDNNTNYLWYRVAMEQADGKNELALTVGDRGDAGDPWPGSSDARNFHDRTSPNTKTNLLGHTGGRTTQIGVWNISDSDSIMYADLDISYSRPYPLLSDSDSLYFDDSPPSGNGDGILDPRERIRFYCTVKNVMRTSYNARVTLTTNSPEVTFINNTVLLTDVFDAAEHTNYSPIEFTLSSAFVPVIDSFFLTVSSDSLGSIPSSSEFSTTFGLEVNIGRPQVLIVDDGEGSSFEEIYSEVLYKQRIPMDIWDKRVDGSPAGEVLAEYPIVFWHTGDSADNVFTADDIAAMKYFMDRGGNMMVSSLSGAVALDDLDPAFMADYFGMTLSGSFTYYPAFTGVPGNQLGDGTEYWYLPVPPVWVEYQSLLDTTNGGEAAFVLWHRSDICGVTFRGPQHNAVFLAFRVEHITDTHSQGQTREDLLARVINFFGGIQTGVNDGGRHATRPGSFSLYQNYPNPFNPMTTISYTLRPTSGPPPNTNLSIYNLLGQRVVTLVDKVQLPGVYSVIWDGSSSSGRPVASGVYFYRLSRGEDSGSKKMVLLK